jgi:ABC-type multidrug transport system ATPase subunit
VGSIISVENLSKHFGKHIAVDHLNLEVSEGEIYGFLGPNGSGKSTTLRMLLGLLTPSNGSIKIENKTLHDNRSAIMQKVGCIIEKPDFYTYLSGIQNLQLFARMHGISPKSFDFAALLQKVGLYGREKDIVKTYSHGMKQRLGLAQALLHNPSIIVLDEPNTGLDPQGIIELRETILHLNKQEGKTIIISSHILPEIEEIADSMILIHNGKTIAQGNIHELLNNEKLIVQVEVDNAMQYQELLANSPWNSFLQKIEKNSFHFTIAQQEIPLLHQWLAKENISVFQIAKTRALENYFLKLTATA